MAEPTFPVRIPGLIGELLGRFRSNDSEAESTAGRRRDLSLSSTMSAFRAWLPVMHLAASVVSGSLWTSDAARHLLNLGVSWRQERPIPATRHAPRLQQLQPAFQTFAVFASCSDRLGHAYRKYSTAQRFTGDPRKCRFLVNRKGKGRRLEWHDSS